MEREVEVVVGKKAVSVSVGSSATRQGSLQDDGSRGVGEEWEAFEEAVVAATYACKANSRNINKGSRTGRTNKS